MSAPLDRFASSSSPCLDSQQIVRNESHSSTPSLPSDRPQRLPCSPWRSFPCNNGTLPTLAPMTFQTYSCKPPLIVLVIAIEYGAHPCASNTRFALDCRASLVTPNPLVPYRGTFRAHT